MTTRRLAIDTATEACSVALEQDGRVTETFEVVGQSHTARLLPMFKAVLAEAGIVPAQLDGFVCGVGPGSFAGVRIGVGFIKGLALALDRPVVPVLSLASLAHRALLRGGQRQVVAVIDARMKQVYCGAYVADADGRMQPQTSPVVAAPSQLTALPAGDWRSVGSGWKAYPDELRRALGEVRGFDAEALPHAEDALHWARAEWQAGRTVGADALEPVYLRDKVALTLDEQARLRPPA